MDQYEAKFAELSRFVPRLIKDPKDYMKKFQDGLHPEIRSKPVPLNLNCL